MILLRKIINNSYIQTRGCVDRGEKYKIIKMIYKQRNTSIYTQINGTGFN